MKLLVFWLGFLAAISVSNANANATSAKDDICNFVSTIEKHGVDAGLKKLHKMIKWNSTIVDAFPVIEIPLKKYKIVSAVGFSTLKLSNLFEQYLIVLNDEKKGNLYLGVEFEKFDGQLKLYNIELHDTYLKTMNKLGGFPAIPSKLNC